MKNRPYTSRSTALLAITAGLVAGCAATYKPPTALPVDTSQEIKGTTAELMRAAKQTLVAEGFQITSADEGAGIISAAPRDTRLTPDVADCGTTMGIDYLKDNRTSGKLGYGILISDNKVKVKATMSASYLPGDVTQSITMSCVSRGVLEAQILSAIAAATPK